MSKRQPVIHHQARWYSYGGLSWGVSDCYCTSYSVQMSANWNQVTCKNCLKRRPREESSMNDTQPICEACWWQREWRKPIRRNEQDVLREWCVFCGDNTRSGIYLSANPRAVSCSAAEEKP